MLTSESLTLRPGCLAENRIWMPSSGWMRNTMREFDKAALVDVAEQHARRLLELDRDSVLRAVMPLPVRM